MRLAIRRVLSVLCVLFGLASSMVQARDSVLTAIPSDAIGFAVAHDLTDASRGIDDVAKLVQAPAPGLLGLAERTTGLQKGLDEQGDLVIVLTSTDPAPKRLVLVPVANFDDFFAAFDVKEPAAGVVEVQLAGASAFVGRKGNYAAIASATDRDALEQYLATTASLATDASLASWLDANQVSVVVTSRGIRQLIPKLTSGIRAAQVQIRQMQGEQGQSVADALGIYLTVLNAVEPEVEQFGIGLRIDSAQTVALVKRVQFTPGGAWAQLAAKIKPATEDLLAGLPDSPYVMAGGGVTPPGAMDSLMKLSVQIMQSQPQLKLTPEQAQKYVELSTAAVRGVRSMAMLLGVAEPGTGLYGNTTAVMMVDDSKQFLDNYEKSLAAMRAFAQEVKSPALPVMTSQRIMLGEMEVLEVSMNLQDMPQFTQPGGPDPQKMMQLLVGADGKLNIYIAPADEHAVVMAYTSLDHLKAALAFYKSNRPGLSGDASLAKVAAALPPGAQGVAYVSIGGMAKLAQQAIAMMGGGPPVKIPDFPDSPPLGIAAKVTPTGLEGYLIVTAETMRAIGDVVADARRAAPGASPPQP